MVIEACSYNVLGESKKGGYLVEALLARAGTYKTSSGWIRLDSNALKELHTCLLNSKEIAALGTPIEQVSSVIGKLIGEPLLKNNDTELWGVLHIKDVQIIENLLTAPKAVQISIGFSGS